ncbi:DUF6518 family protein [Micromonospora sp. CPCC 206061]|uniref:DUF6518 family protein n=1 Tax=Micromonospora sp. CPCC 206061 TaxID=3122410 RepID=UPI002FF4038F
MPGNRAVAVWSVVAGVLLGSADFMWIKYLPSPWGDLGNSPAIWAVAAFWLGYWVRAGWVRAATAGAAMLVLAVPTYYLTATVVQQDDVRMIWQAAAQIWMLFGVLAGVIFGMAGTWPMLSGYRALVGTALPGAVLWGEAAVLLYRGQSGDLWTAALEAALGTAVIMIVGRSARQRMTALAMAVPLAIVGFLAYYVVGIGGVR